MRAPGAGNRASPSLGRGAAGNFFNKLLMALSMGMHEADVMPRFSGGGGSSGGGRPTIGLVEGDTTGGSFRGMPRVGGDSTQPDLPPAAAARPTTAARTAAASSGDAAGPSSRIGAAVTPAAARGTVVASPTAARPSAAATVSAGTSTIAPQIAAARSRGAFMEACKRYILSVPNHPLLFLMDGEDWRKTTRITKSGKTQRGRYAGSEHGPVVQAGHTTARRSGALQVFSVEDADLNQVGGQTIETPGGVSMKISVVIGNVPVDQASAMQWARVVPGAAGILESAPRIMPPPI